MARDISAMEEDLKAAVAAHVASSQAGVESVAERMATAARAASSPLYGVSVQARTVNARDGKRVDVLIRSTDGPGKVFGGQSAVRAHVASVMDQVAKEDGLDRRR
jgi:hypothetical protein